MAGEGFGFAIPGLPALGQWFKLFGIGGESTGATAGTYEAAAEVQRRTAQYQANNWAAGIEGAKDGIGTFTNVYGEQQSLPVEQIALLLESVQPALRGRDWYRSQPPGGGNAAALDNPWTPTGAPASPFQSAGGAIPFAPGQPGTVGTPPLPDLPTWQEGLQSVAQLGLEIWLALRRARQAATRRR